MKELKQLHYHFVDSAQIIASLVEGSSSDSIFSDKGMRA